MHRSWRCTEGGVALKDEGVDAPKVVFHGFKDRDQGSGSRIGIKGRDQGSGSRIGIKDPDQGSVSRILIKNRYQGS